MKDMQETTPAALCREMSEAVAQTLFACAREQAATWGDAAEEIVQRNMPLAALFAAVACAKNLQLDREEFLGVCRQIITQELQNRSAEK